MPDPVESKHEQIMAKLKTTLEGIARADGFWYPPEHVLRVKDPLFDHFAEAQQADVKIFYLLFPGDDEIPKGRSTGAETKTMEVGIIACRRSNLDREPSDRATGYESPFVADEPLKVTVENRLLKDIKDKLSADLTLGGLCMEIRLAHENRHYHVDGWDTVHLPLEIDYHHPRAQS